MRIGWTYEQNFDTLESPKTLNYFTLSLLPYVEGQLKLKSTFDIKFLYYNEFTIEIPKSKREIGLHLSFNGDGQLCPGLTMNRDAAKISVTMKSHFAQCSKILINEIGSTYGVWTGPDAKYFQECGFSPDVTATFNTWNFWDSLQKSIVYGTLDPDSTNHCYTVFDPMALFSESNPIDLMG